MFRKFVSNQPKTKKYLSFNSFDLKNESNVSTRLKQFTITTTKLSSAGCGLFGFGCGVLNFTDKNDYFPVFLLRSLINGGAIGMGCAIAGALWPITGPLTAYYFISKRKTLGDV